MVIRFRPDMSKNYQKALAGYQMKTRRNVTIQTTNIPMIMPCAPLIGFWGGFGMGFGRFLTRILNQFLGGGGSYPIVTSQGQGAVQSEDQSLAKGIAGLKKAYPKLNINEINGKVTVTSKDGSETICSGKTVDEAQAAIIEYQSKNPSLGTQQNTPAGQSTPAGQNTPTQQSTAQPQAGERHAGAGTGTGAANIPSPPQSVKNSAAQAIDVKAGADIQVTDYGENGGTAIRGATLTSVGDHDSQKGNFPKSLTLTRSGKTISYNLDSIKDGDAVYKSVNGSQTYFLQKKDGKLELMQPAGEQYLSMGAGSADNPKWQ